MTGATDDIWAQPEPPDRGPARRRGRRAASAPAASVDEDLTTLAARYEQAVATDTLGSCAAILQAWRELRDRPVPELHRAAAARLDAWLALDLLARDPAAMHAADSASQRLRSAGLAVEALLHEQACLLTATRAALAGGWAGPLSGRQLDLAAAAGRVEALAAEVVATAGAGDAGVALLRLVLIRELGAGAGVALPGRAPDPAGTIRDDPLQAGLAALTSLPPEQLDHRQSWALCRLLRLRAGDEPPEPAVQTLRSAVAALPDGLHPLERALACADLAGALQDSDPVAALAAWQRAIDDATTAGADAVLGNLLAARAGLRHASGDPEGAADDLSRAVPMLAEHAGTALTAQARLDLSRALLDAGDGAAAAHCAEAALADLSALVAAGGEDPAALHLAGSSAFAAAQAHASTPAPEAAQRARQLIEVSAGWHERNGNPVAQAEAWQLAARIGGPAERIAADLARAAELSEAGGDWERAAICRRERAAVLHEALGPQAALQALALASEALEAHSAVGRHAAEAERRIIAGRLRWQALAVAEQRARLLALSGEFGLALAQVEGVPEAYRELGDEASGRDAAGLRGQLRAELGDVDGGLADLSSAAQQAADAGDRGQAAGLGQRLAAVLELAGRPADAEAAWKRFGR